ncbi:hypothetical protein ACIQVT_00555 [Streptomyces sp. NPDC100445]|uniref:hypothetical protein n=1 Tax=Streptomyces sp. NPDC100445 TaxID=3366102 RepID=UPI00380A1734
MALAAAGLMTAAAVPASAADAPVPPAESYQELLDNHQPVPLSRAEAGQHEESKTFLAAANADHLSDHDTDALLSSGRWIVYPVSVTAETVTQEPEAGTETTVTKVTSSVAAEKTSTETVPLKARTQNGYLKQVYWLNGADGRHFAYFQMRENYSYNGKAVTAYEQPIIDHKVYTWAEVLGWSFEGLDLSGSQGPFYYSWHGNAHGALQTWRKGNFKYDPTHLDIGSMHRYPWLHFYQHADGTEYETDGM